MYDIKKLPKTAFFFILVVFFILELCLISLDLPNGDEGIYITSSYMLTKGYLPHIDFWWPQADGLLYIIAPFIFIFGASLFSMKIMTSFFSISIVWIIVATFKSKQMVKWNSTLTLVFLFIIISPFHFWFFMGQVGTKESIFAFFLVLSVYSCIKACDCSSILITLLSSFLFSTVISIKPTAITLGLPFVLYMLNQLPKKFVLTFVISGIFWLMTLHLHIILGDGMQSFVSNLIEVKSHNELRNLGHLDGIIKILLNLFTLILSVVPTLILLNLFNFSFAKRSPEGDLFYSCFCIGILTNTVLFFPFSDYSYYLMYLPLLYSSLPYTALHKENNISFLLSKRKCLSVFFCFLSTYLIAVSINYKPEYILFKDRRSIFYFGYSAEDFSEALARSLKAEEILYLGRHQHSILTLNPSLHPASVTSTSVMDLWKPSRNVANKNKVYATSNFFDIINEVKIVILEAKTIDKHPNIELSQIMDDLIEAGYVSHWSNDEHMFFIK